MSASTIIISGNIVAPYGGYMNINTIVASSLSTATLYANTVNATNFTTTELDIAYLSLTSSFTADNVSSFSAQNAAIDNRGGSISTGSIYLTNLAATSTITNTSGQFVTTS
jgi:hypothetical protein